MNRKKSYRSQPKSRSQQRSNQSQSTKPHTGKRRTGKRRTHGEHVEGRQATRELLRSGRRRVHAVWVADSVVSGRDAGSRGNRDNRDDTPIVAEIIRLAQEQNVKVNRVTATELNKLAHTSAPQGVVAHADPVPILELEDVLTRAPESTPEQTHQHAPESTHLRIPNSTRQHTPEQTLANTPERNTSPFLLLIDQVKDPHNLGAILRSAECAGVTGVILPEHSSAPITPTVIKTAAGAVEHIPIAYTPRLPSVMRTLQKHNIWILGLDPASDKSLYEVNLASEAVALVVGAEDQGMSQLVSKRCDLLVSLPVYGEIGSLNVSTAATVACYEIARHRQPRRQPRPRHRQH